MDLDRSSGHKIGYAMYISGATFEGRQNFTKISPLLAIDILSSISPNLIVVDHINELRSEPVMEDFVLNPHSGAGHIPIKIVQITRSLENINLSIMHLMGKYFPNYHKKPDPLTTAIMCVLMFQKGEGVEIDIASGNIIGKSPILSSEKSSSAISTTKIQIKEYSHREGYLYIQNLPKVKRILNNVATGKESNVYLIESLNKEILIMKLFRSYTPPAKSLQASTEGATSSSIATILAKREMKYLKILSPRCRSRMAARAG